MCVPPTWTRHTVGWGDVSVSRAPAAQACAPELDVQLSGKSWCWGGSAAEGDRSIPRAGWPSNAANPWAQGAEREPALKTEAEEQKALDVDLWPLYLWAHVPAHKHIIMYTHSQPHIIVAQNQNEDVDVRMISTTPLEFVFLTSHLCVVMWHFPHYWRQNGPDKVNFLRSFSLHMVKVRSGHVATRTNITLWLSTAVSQL